MFQEITHNGKLLAIIISRNYQQEGIKFFTPQHFSQQLAYMDRPAGHEIPPHTHKKVSREVVYTQEVLFLRKGKLQVDFYDHDHHYIRSEILTAGDVIMLASGGHGFKVLEDIEMFEVKQGPYAGDEDKQRFEGIS